MSCTPGAAVCDDTGTSTDLALLLPQAVAVLALVCLAALALARLVRRRRAARPPVVRVWVDADGEVVHRSSLRP